MMGQKLSMKTIAVTYGYMEKQRLVESQPDRIVDSPFELLKAIESLES
jgi:phosphoglycolate phosphatase-like HAD superfamily hydrolase